MENINKEYLNSLSLYELNFLIEGYEHFIEENRKDKIVCNELDEKIKQISYVIAERFVEMDTKIFCKTGFALIRKK